VHFSSNVFEYRNGKADKNIRYDVAAGSVRPKDAVEGRAVGSCKKMHSAIYREACRMSMLSPTFGIAHCRSSMACQRQYLHLRNVMETVEAVSRSFENGSFTFHPSRQSFLPLKKGSAVVGPVGLRVLPSH
jgi:hypothetical protein